MLSLSVIRKNRKIPHKSKPPNLNSVWTKWNAERIYPNGVSSNSFGDCCRRKERKSVQWSRCKVIHIDFADMFVQRDILTTFANDYNKLKHEYKGIIIVLLRGILLAAMLAAQTTFMIDWLYYQVVNDSSVSLKCLSVIPPSLDNTRFIQILIRFVLWRYRAEALMLIPEVIWILISEGLSFELDALANDTAFGMVAVSTGESCPVKILTTAPASCHHFTAGTMAIPTIPAPLRWRRIQSSLRTLRVWRNMRKYSIRFAKARLLRFWRHKACEKKCRYIYSIFKVANPNGISWTLAKRFCE